jgi:hypothetical protein
MRRFALAAVVLAAVAAAVAYGLAGGGPPSASAAVARAAGRLLDSGSSRVTITYGPDAPGAFARGVVDYRAHRGELQYGPLTKTIFDRDSTLVYEPVVTRSLPGAKPWIRFPTGKPDPFDPQEQALSDPARLLPFLRETSGDVRAVGHDVLDGVETTHYEGTLDLEKIVDHATGDDRAELQDTLDFLKQVKEPTTIPYGLWVDESGLARRLRYVEGSAQPAATTTIDFSDFGVPVVLDLPAEDQVMSADDFFALAEQQWKDGGSDDCKSQQSSDGAGEGAMTLCFRLGEPAK